MGILYLLKCIPQCITVLIRPQIQGINLVQQRLHIQIQAPQRCSDQLNIFRLIIGLQPLCADAHQCQIGLYVAYIPVDHKWMLCNYPDLGGRLVGTVKCYRKEKYQHAKQNYRAHQCNLICGNIFMKPLLSVHVTSLPL